MKVGEILSQVQGLTRSELNWLEVKGYLKPQLVNRGKHDRRDYSKNDLQLIQTLQKYRNEGYNLTVAYDKAIEELRKKESQEIFPTSDDTQKVFYAPFQDRLNKFFEKVFAGKELSLEEMCLRTISVLIISDYQDELGKLFSSLPIEQTPSGKYRYQRNIVKDINN